MMSIKSVLALTVAAITLSAGVALASGPDEFALQPGMTVTTYSNDAFVNTGNTFVQPMVDVNSYTVEETMQTETMQYAPMPVETMEYAPMPVETTQYGTVDQGTLGEPVTVDINDYLLPETGQ